MLRFSPYYKSNFHLIFCAPWCMIHISASNSCWFSCEP
nr:MAG TPA: hypothetical protein [Caudoviricetes sp.]